MSIVCLIPVGGGWGGDSVVWSVAVGVVPLPATPLTVQFLNRWMPVSWWSWEEEGEAFCWAAGAACAAGGIKQHTSSNVHFGFLCRRIRSLNMTIS